MYTWSLYRFCINECGSGAVHTSTPLPQTVPTPRSLLQPPAARPIRAFITSTRRPTIQVCFPPHNLRYQTDHTSPYTAHSNNKDAKINPSTLKRKLSAAISAWMEVMPRERMKETRRKLWLVEPEGKCQPRNKNSQQINANVKHTSKLKRPRLNANVDSR